MKRDYDEREVDYKKQHKRKISNSKSRKKDSKKEGDKHRRDSDEKDRYKKRNHYSRSRSKSRSPPRKREKFVKERSKSREKKKERSIEKRHKHIENKEELKDVKIQNKIKNDSVIKKNGLIFEFEEQLASTQDAFDIVPIDKEFELEKRREERKKKIEEIRKKFEKKELKDTSQILEQKPNTKEDPAKFDIHMKDYDRAKLLKLVEEEREKNLQDEMKLLHANKKNEMIQESSINHGGDKSVKSIVTPDMFAATPIDEDLINQKEVLNIKPLEGNDGSTGYYTPKLNEIINDKYKIIGVCGKGIFSSVVKVIDLNTNKELALKIIRSIDVMLISGEKERSILKKLNEIDKQDKSHIIRLIDSFELKRHICMVFELYEMNLRDLIKSKGVGVGLPLNVVRNFSQQLLFAFDLIHKYRIIHADFKPDNTVVNKTLNSIKLCDFGSALQEDEVVITSELVSRFYRAPEIMLGCSYDTKIDIWSLGCTVYELYTGKILFPGRNNNDMIKLIMQVKGKIPQKIMKRGQFTNLYFNDKGDFLSIETDPYNKKEYIKEINANTYPTKDLLSLLKSAKGQMSTSEENTLMIFRDFLEKCLHLDPNKRFNALEALSHEFIGLMPIKSLLQK